MTASSPQCRIKQKFQAGHTESEGRAGRSDRFRHHTQPCPYSVTVCGHVIPWPLFSSALLSGSPIPHSVMFHTWAQNTHRHEWDVFLSIKHFCSILTVSFRGNTRRGLSGVGRGQPLSSHSHVCRCSAPRINKKCLHIHSPRLRRHKAPSVTQTALAVR